MTKLLQQCFLFFIVVVMLGHNLGNSQVSVYRTTGLSLVVECLCPVCQKYFSYVDFHFGVLKIDIAVAFCVITHCDNNRIMS